MKAGLRYGLIFLIALAYGLASSTEARAQAAPAAPAAQNQASSSHMGVGLGFGQVFLTGQMGSEFSNNIGFNLNYAYEAGPTFGLYVNLHINSHGDNVDPSDSLSIKSLIPNLKVNLYTIHNLTLSAFAGLGASMVGENLAGQSASYFLFTMDGGIMAMVDIDHIRFGPSLSFISYASGTDNSSSSSSGATSGTTTSPTNGMSIGGSSFELFFNVMYMF